MPTYPPLSLVFHQLLDDEVLPNHQPDNTSLIFLKNSSSISVANFLFFKLSTQDTK
ncbi:MAG: hypothetical protein LBC61_04170 [Candidatus Peribacteria bacterium]|nr:hypothetical protein [Candidatus Peribacteria bacterium]